VPQAGQTAESAIRRTRQRLIRVALRRLVKDDDIEDPLAEREDPADVLRCMIQQGKTSVRVSKVGEFFSSSKRSCRFADVLTARLKISMLARNLGLNERSRMRAWMRRPSSRRASSSTCL